MSLKSEGERERERGREGGCKSETEGERECGLVDSSFSGTNCNDKSTLIYFVLIGLHQL